MNPIASRLSQASIVMEGTPHPELAEALRIGADEIARLQGIIDRLPAEGRPDAVALKAAPELIGKHAIVLYFNSDADRDEFVLAIREAKPNMHTQKL